MSRKPIPWLPERDPDGRTFAADDPRHGTTNGYTNHGCRCDDCRAAWREAHHAYMNADPVRLAKHAERERRRRATLANTTEDS